MRLRSEVFVVEQNCIYLDLDDKDVESIHLFASAKGAASGASARAVVRWCLRVYRTMSLALAVLPLIWHREARGWGRS